MNDAVVLIALAQVISFGGLLFLYMQVQSMARATSAPFAVAERPRRAPATPNGTEEILARLGELNVDVPAMARRMHKSEEEIRLLLRRQAAGRSG